MRSKQAWGWLAAGVVALGLNGFYQDGGAAWAHRMVDQLRDQIAERSSVMANLAAEQFNSVAERLQLAAARNESSSAAWRPR